MQVSTLVSFPGQPVRVPLAMPEGFPFGEAVWVPSPIQVRLFTPNDPIDPVEPISEIIGFTAISPVDLGARQSWLKPAWNWQTLSPDEVTEAPTGPIYWMLFVRLPERFDAPNIRGQQDGRDQALILQIGDERFPVRLAPNPSELPTGRIPQLEADPAQWLALGDQLAAEAMDPTRRWRVELLLDRFPAPKLFATATLDERFPLSDPVLRGLTNSLETEWRAVLSDLAATEPDLAASVLAKLTHIVRMPSGDLLPAWPTDGLAETQLLPALLSRTLSREERVEAARRYLDTRPRTRVTVLDDAGQSLTLQNLSRFRDDDEIAEQIFTTRGARLLITNLTPGNRVLTLGSPGEFDSRIQRLSPFASVEALFEPKLVSQLSDSAPAAQGAVTADAILRDEGRETRVSFRVAPGIVRRPGLQIGPALEPWTLDAWNSDSVRSTRADLQTGLLLYRDDRDQRWKLLIEARTTSDLEDRQDESVSVFIGPYGSPIATLVIDAKDPQTAHRSDRWSSIIELPAALQPILAEEWLTVGFIRIGPGGSKSSWPRPLLPGQSEPGRIRLDLRDWSESR